ncbi:hypothetical protein EDC04DRAFT_2624942 [Pisolithus marmoratus]|nr:hypothetical protein EDC04DRAFT_2624942 [Pisolithus marmoratus]
MGPDPFDDHTSGQVVGSLATGSELPSSLLHQRQDTHPSGGLTSGSVPLLRDQVRTGMAASAGFYGGVISQPTQQTHLPTTFSDTLPTPPQHNPAFYPTPNDSTLCHPSMQMGNKMPTPQFPQSLQGPRFHTSGTVDHHTAHMLSNHRLPTSSNRATYNPDDLSTRNPPGVVYEYGSFDHKKYNSAQIAGSDCQVSWSVPSNSDISVPQELYVSDYSGGESARIVTNPSAPTMHTPVTHVFHDSTTGMTPGFVGNHAEMDPAFSQNIDLNLPSSSLPDAAQPPYELYTSNHLPNTGGGDLTIPSGFPAAYHPHKHAHRYRIPCGWVNPNGMRCNMFIGYDCKEHFATVHGIKNISSKEIIPCLWCRLDTRKRRGRKGFLRHIREVHMKFRREKKRSSRTLEKKKKRRRDQ